MAGEWRPMATRPSDQAHHHFTSAVVRRCPTSSLASRTDTWEQRLTRDRDGSATTSTVSETRQTDDDVTSRGVVIFVFHWISTDRGAMRLVLIALYKYPYTYLQRNMARRGWADTTLSVAEASITWANSFDRSFSLNYANSRTCCYSSYHMYYAVQ